MSYSEQASDINEVLKNIAGFNNFDQIEKNKLIDAILRFGQVAKFRCRSNVAYDNFARECFKDIAELERAKPFENAEFEVLRVKI